MIFEHRDYWIKTGSLQGYLDNFENIALPITKRYMDLVGFWFTDIGDAGHAHHLWRWDSLDARAEGRKALFADDDWQKLYLPVVLPVIVKQHVTILNRAQFSPL